MIASITIPFGYVINIAYFTLLSINGTNISNIQAIMNPKIKMFFKIFPNFI